MVAERTFRDDLFYRLSVMTLELPPLRRYKAQIEVTASVFVELAASRLGKPTPRIGSETLALLEAYDYPGNVRELRNAIEHAVILCTRDELRPEDLPAPFRGAGAVSQPPPPARAGELASLEQMRERWLAPLERRYLIDLLATCAGNVRRAAARAAVDPATLYRLLRRRGVTVRRQAQVTAAGSEEAAR
jgi:DNA-binding NtrC family response regulator